MKWITFLFAFVVAVCSGSAREEEVVKQACGTASITVLVQILDDSSGAAILGAKVTFMSLMDVRRRRFIEADIQRGDMRRALPSGVHALTGTDGIAELRVTFGYSAATYTDGRVDELRYPQGEFTIEHSDYVMISAEARDLFQGIRDVPDRFQLTIRIKKKGEPGATDNPDDAQRL